MICYECGKMIGEGQFTIIDNKVYCNDCTIECVDCGEIIPKDVATKTNNGYVCEDCLENYCYCNNCEKYYHCYDTTYIDGNIYCDNCRDDLFTVCNDCNEWVNLDDALWVEDGEYYICESCYENYVTCDSCGDIIRYEDAYYSNDCYYCETCYDDKLPKVIYNYHSFDNYRLLKLPDEEESKIQTYGFELEVSGDRDYAEDFLRFFDDEEVILMNDGSIVDDGFEIITMPMSERYIYEVFMPKFSKGLKFLRENDFAGHNHGGLHIHVGYINPKTLAELASILYYGNEIDKNTWHRITQRSSSAMSRWSSLDNHINSYEEIKNEGYSTISNTRYTAINYDYRTSTYEFRIFNSNIREERFLKNFECVKALLDYASKSRKKCNTDGFIKYVNKNPLFYPNLHAFFIEKEIVEKKNVQVNALELEVA